MPRRPVKAATIIRIVPPIDRMSSGRSGQRNGPSVRRSRDPYMCDRALAERELESPAGATVRAASEPADVVAHRAEEAFGIDAHPEDREGDRARAATIRAG